jgi:divalent metal cation (Fe/Co/Zn/Cd) transporter
VKYLLALLLVLSPAIASAEATGGYSYGFGNGIAGIIFVGILVLVAMIVILWKRRKGRK